MPLYDFVALAQQGGHSLTGRATMEVKDIKIPYYREHLTHLSRVPVIWKGARRKASDPKEKHNNNSRHPQDRRAAYETDVYERYLRSETDWYEYLFQGIGQANRRASTLMQHVAPYLGQVEHEGMLGICIGDVGTPMNKYLSTKRMQNGFVNMSDHQLTPPRAVASVMLRDPQTGALVLAESVELATRTWESLRFLHLRGIVHGDLKPSNLVVGEDRYVRVIDFGRSFRSRATAHHPLLPTDQPPPAAPTLVAATRTTDPDAAEKAIAPSLPHHRPATGMYDPSWWSTLSTRDFCRMHPLDGEATDVFGAALISMDWLVGLPLESTPQPLRDTLKQAYLAYIQDAGKQSVSASTFFLVWSGLLLAPSSDIDTIDAPKSPDSNNNKKTSAAKPTSKENVLDRRRDRLQTLLGSFDPSSSSERHPLFELWSTMTHMDPKMRPSMFAALDRWKKWTSTLVSV